MRLRRAVVAAVACLLAGCLLAGCAAGQSGLATSAPPPTPTTPDQGQSLSALGFTNGPAELIWLPRDVRITYGADQPNALIASGDAAQGPLVEDFLRLTLPGLGWRITADADGGLLFQQGEWQGAYALGGDSWALTVRND